MKKIITCISIFTLAAYNSVYSQTNSDVEIPQEYKAQFEKDQKRYADYMNPLDSTAGVAFNFWKNASDGYLKGYSPDSLRSVFKNLKLQAMKAQVDFIKKNPSCYASLFYFDLSLLHSSIFTPDSLLKIYSWFTPQLQATVLGKNINKSISRKQTLLLNHEMPSFSFKTDSGEQLSLSAFRGKKHILICFWASWCGPCISNIPLLKKLEKAYKEKGLKIISVSIDDDNSKWLAALKQYSMPWLQTCDVPAFTKERLRTLYEIHFIPQYFLIDKEGKLIYQDVLAADNDDYTALEATLNTVLGGK